jgi:N-methylhydantoinase A
MYGPRDDEAALEVISVRATVVGTTRKAAPVWAGEREPGKPLGMRRIDVDGVEYDCPVYVRSGMPPGWKADGPFVVDQPDTTCVVTKGWRAEVDAIGTLHLRKPV